MSAVSLLFPLSLDVILFLAEWKSYDSEYLSSFITKINFQIANFQLFFLIFFLIIEEEHQIKEKKRKKSGKKKRDATPDPTTTDISK